MIIIWLLGGIAAVTIAFFVPSNSPELWPSLNMAMIPAALYILALSFYTLRSPITRTARIVSWVIIVLIGGAMYSSWTGMEVQSRWQHNQLLKIHSAITRGLLQSYAQPAALSALKEYYQQGKTKKESLGKVFQRLNPGAAAGSKIQAADMPQDSSSIVVKSIAENEVVLLGRHQYSNGRNPDFKNYNGKTGKVQERFTLTEKGVSYESEN
ncbi:MAG: hypothetical protein EHM64_14260 [Ignavibacteriae bacterium]|nr:MAG: hypothetical protein EHM64_14260 [Ignavibacteriota bacterium]